MQGSNFILARKESLRLHPSLPIQHPNFKTPGISEHSRFHTELEVPEEGPLDTGDLRWFTRNVLAQALPNGYCAIPVIAGPCPHPNACLNCAHFRTDASFLDVHKAELRDTERVITKANANGWTRQIEMNERKRNNLVNIVTSLERPHA